MKLVPTFAFLTIAAVLAGCKSADTPASTADANKSATSPVASKDFNTTPPPTDTTRPASPPPARTPDTTQSAPTSPNPNNTQYSIVGDWNTDGNFFKGSLEYKADGTMTFHFTDPEGTLWDGTGTYKLESGKLTLHMATVHFTAGPKADAKTRKAIEEQNAKPPVASDEVSAIAWKDKDTILATGSDGKSVTTFTRKK